MKKNNKYQKINNIEDYIVKKYGKIVIIIYFLLLNFIDVCFSTLGSISVFNISSYEMDLIYQNSILKYISFLAPINKLRFSMVLFATIICYIIHLINLIIEEDMTKILRKNNKFNNKFKFVKKITKYQKTIYIAICIIFSTIFFLLIFYYNKQIKFLLEIINNNDKNFHGNVAITFVIVVFAAYFIFQTYLLFIQFSTERKNNLLFFLKTSLILLTIFLILSSYYTGLKNSVCEFYSTETNKYCKKHQKQQKYDYIIHFKDSKLFEDSCYSENNKLIKPNGKFIQSLDPFIFLYIDENFGVYHKSDIKICKYNKTN